MSNLRKFQICQDHKKDIKYYDSWCDYMRINFRGNHWKFHDILNNLNTTNTPYFEDNNIVYTKLRLSMWDCLIANTSFNWKPYPLFLYNEFDEKTKKIMNKHWRIDFYGSLFRLKQLWYDIDLTEIIWWIKNQQSISLSRYDYRIDFFFSKRISIPQPKKCFRGWLDKWTPIQPYFSISWQKKEYVSWLAWIKDNLSYVIRVYDKIKDTKSKQKYWLFTDYLKRRSVHRYEIQFMNRTIKDIPWYEADIRLWQSIEKSIFWNSWFDHEMSKFPEIEKKDVYERSIKYHTEMISKQFVWRWNTITSTWQNPFILLALWLTSRRWLWHKKTKELINSFLERHKSS